MRTEPHHEFCSARFTERCSGAKHGEREAGDDVNVEPRAGRGQGRRRREEREREGGSVRCSITLVSAVRSGRSGVERSSDSVLRGPQYYSRARTTRPDRATRSGTDPPLPAEKTETFYSLTYFFFYPQLPLQPKQRVMPSINMKLEMVTIIACEVDTEVFTSDKMQVRCSVLSFVKLK